MQPLIDWIAERIPWAGTVVLGQSLVTWTAAALLAIVAYVVLLVVRSRIRNDKRMQERRVPFSVGVTYQTPVEELEAIPGVVREIIESSDATRFDRAHFKAFGDSAYLFEIVHYVLSADYNRFMDVQQVINLGICRVFESHGIEFAYPTRTLHLATPIQAATGS